MRRFAGDVCRFSGFARAGKGATSGFNQREML